MSDLVSDHVYCALITGEKSGSDKCQTGIFHTTIWERRWKNEQIITTPFIWSQQFFTSNNELFGILSTRYCQLCKKLFYCSLQPEKTYSEFPSGRINDFRLAPHCTTGPDFASYQVTSSNGDKIRRNCCALLKAVCFLSVSIILYTSVEGRHYHLKRRGNIGRVC
jgi:hypothetical protein